MIKLFFAFLVAAILAFAPAAMADDVDRSDPQAVTVAFLEAWKARDLKAMAPLMNSNNTEFFQELAAAGKNHPRYDRIFSGWRDEAAMNWDGTLEATRYDRGNALVPIGAAGSETFVVVLFDEADGWAVEDINSPSTKRFEGLPTSP
ncbi:MAG: hypothetical protein AAGF49_15105 [Pseudomonadota bacterium]